MNLRGILLTPHKSEDLQFLRVLSLSGELLFAAAGAGVHCQKIGPA